ncbi:MAG: hypothetical protein FWD57_01845 [Polyangiaceae bacterium]|nr:hypothetical protein [Polyangiaceae bacterium]
MTSHKTLSVSFSTIATIAIAAITVCACTHKPPASQFPNAASALDQMKATYSCATGVQGEAKLDYMNDSGRIRGDSMLMAVNPDSVRFDIISPFGVTLATLTSDGKDFAFFDMQNSSLLTGPPEPCNIARLTRVEMPAHAIVRLLRGEAPLLVHNPSDASIRWSGSGYYIVQIPSLHEATQEIHLQPNPSDFALPYQKQRIRVLHISVKQRDYIHYRASLSDHQSSATMPPRLDELGLDPPIEPSGPKCSAEVPRRIHIDVPYTKDDVRFRYQEVGLNPPLPDGVFTQPVPGGVRVQRVQCSTH